jgi:type II secretory pathway pseudopilin PulG
MELLLVLAVVAVAGFVLMRYVGATATTVERLQKERPLGQARLAADQATLASIETVVRGYHARHGQWPADRAAVLALLAGPPRWQCAGNDLDYDPARGTLALRIVSPDGC